MIRKAMLGKTVIGFALMVGLCLVLSDQASAGRGGMGGGGFGGVRGGFQTGGFPSGSAAFPSGGGGVRSGHGGFQGARFHYGSRFHGGSCCVNGAFIGGYVLGSVFPAPAYYYSYPYPVNPWPLDVPSLTVPPGAQMDISPSIQREACFISGCYRLNGDGVEVAYQWIWVPAPPPPPTVIPYPNGRYELRGPYRWEWIPNPAASPQAAPPVSSSSSRAPEPVGATISKYGLYRWTDEHGVTHWTQSPEAIPERYRPRAKPGAGVDGTL
jgi:Domain of unknown function (DUF4124)